MNPTTREAVQMNRDQLIEAAAKAMYNRRKGRTDSPWEKINTQHREPYRKDVRAVLSAIEAAGLSVVYLRDLDGTGSMSALSRFV